MTDHYDRLMLDYGFSPKNIRMMRYSECANDLCRNKVFHHSPGPKICRVCYNKLVYSNRSGQESNLQIVHIPDILTKEYSVVF